MTRRGLFATLAGCVAAKAAPLKSPIQKRFAIVPYSPHKLLSSGLLSLDECRRITGYSNAPGLLDAQLRYESRLLLECPPPLSDTAPLNGNPTPIL